MKSESTPRLPSIAHTCDALDSVRATGGGFSELLPRLLPPFLLPTGLEPRSDWISGKWWRSQTSISIGMLIGSNPHALWSCLFRGAPSSGFRKNSTLLAFPYYPEKTEARVSSPYMSPCPWIGRPVSTPAGITEAHWHMCPYCVHCSTWADVAATTYQ